MSFTSSTIVRCLPGSSDSPSAPTRVETTGSPQAPGQRVKALISGPEAGDQEDFCAPLVPDIVTAFPNVNAGKRELVGHRKVVSFPPQPPSIPFTIIILRAHGIPQLQAVICRQPLWPNRTPFATNSVT